MRYFLSLPPTYRGVFVHIISHPFPHNFVQSVWLYIVVAPPVRALHASLLLQSKCCCLEQKLVMHANEITHIHCVFSCYDWPKRLSSIPTGVGWDNNTRRSRKWEPGDVCYQSSCSGIYLVKQIFSVGNFIMCIALTKYTLIIFYAYLRVAC